MLSLMPGFQTDFPHWPRRTGLGDSEGLGNAKWFLIVPVAGLALLALPKVMGLAGAGLAGASKHMAGAMCGATGLLCAVRPKHKKPRAYEVRTQSGRLESVHSTRRQAEEYLDYLGIRGKVVSVPRGLPAGPRGKSGLRPKVLKARR